MSKSTNIKQSEQLNIQENVENNHKQNSPLIEREPIPRTPFTIIKTQTEYFMVMGDYRVTETTKTKEEQLDKLDTEKWLLITHICIIAIEKMQKSDRDFQQYQENIHSFLQREQENKAYETESL